MHDVVIVGGGIAGLAAAYELHQRGVAPLVLERSSRPGGVILSERVGPYVIDGGPDALLTEKPAAIDLCRELGLSDRLIPTKPPRLAFIQRDGRLHPLPAASVLGIPTRLGPLVGTRLFSWRAKLRMAWEVAVPRKADDVDESIGAFIGRRFGREAVTWMAEPLLAGIHSGDVDALSVRALFPRFLEIERTHGSLIRGFRRSRGHVAVDGAFRSLPNGLGELVDRLVGALPDGTLRLNAHAGPLAAGGDRGAYTVRVGDGQLLAARAVVLATPAFVTADLVRPIDAELASLCAALRYVSTGIVVMAFDRRAISHPLNGSGMVVPRVERSGITAATWISSKWPHRAPDDKVLLRAFIGGGRDPEALRAGDEQLIATARIALTRVLGIEGEPELTRVYRWERASPQYEVGCLDRARAMETRLSRLPGLYVVGSGFRAVGIPDVVADARKTAGEAARWLADQGGRR